MPTNPGYATRKCDSCGKLRLQKLRVAKEDEATKQARKDWVNDLAHGKEDA
jgi:hypothetical protein